MTTPGVLPGVFAFWIDKASGKWYNIRIKLLCMI